MTPDEALRVLSEQPGAMVPGTERSRALEVVVTTLDEARAELARRDTTIAAAGQVLAAWDTDCPGGIHDSVYAAMDRLRAALSAPVEAGATEPARERDAAAEAVLARWAFLSDDDAHSTMSLADATGLVDVVARTLAEAGAPAEPVIGAASEANPNGSCPDCGYEGPHNPLRVRPDQVECGGTCGASWTRPDADPRVVEALDFWQHMNRDEHLSARADTFAPAEPTSDTASCGICKLGGRTIHIDDRCAEHGDHDLDDVAGAADTAREDQP
ncbi:MAG TPA: hypothetical protein VIQ30_25530 [Pseudonocardia sp.]